MVNKIKIATLNVKGLNNPDKAQKTLTLLKSYHIDIIMLQETNLENKDTREFLHNQWGYSSHWATKTAILSSNRNILFQNIKESHNGRVITAEFTYNQQPFRLINVYAPPNVEDRSKFFNSWAPQVEEDKINILAGDFNTNLDPLKNRISQAAITNDPTRELLKRLTSEYMDSATIVAEEDPFLTYYQNTRGGHKMATRLDYIFIDANHGQYCKKVATYFGNSDHLLVECELYLSSVQSRPKQWRFD